MTADVTVNTVLSEEEQLYNEGWDDGYEGNARKSEHPSYVEGYFDGMDEADESNNDGDYDWDW